ncbi:MAG: hypothetical protein HY661_13400 [Betaproteobacteria bacterium]|nr:hypothetical protein [Betaproteobacteria bacterium]
MNTADAAAAAALRGYPERDDVRRALADRVVERVSARLHRMLGRGLGDADAYVRQIERMADSLRAAPPQERLPQMRYRLRRDGYTDSLILECLALCSIGLEQKGIAQPAAVSYVAAAALLRRSIVAVADDDSRFAALALAVTAGALRGEPVHVLTRGDARAVEIARLLGTYCDPMGVRVAAVAPGMQFRAKREAYAATVVCSSTRETGLDYLRDRLQLGARQGELANVAARLSGDAPVEERLLLRGLYCAFVEDAELVMIDDARLPLVISAEADRSRERLLYEQALELARALDQERDFTMENGEPALTDDGRQRLAQLVSPLGGIWAARNRCEELIVIALRALREFVRDRDYQVVQGRVVFPAPAGKEGEDRSEGDEMLQKLTEVKEGCALSGRRDVLARMSVPRFLNRYLRLAGVCSDARPVEHEFWSLYGLRVTGEDLPRKTLPCKARVFVSAQARLDAIVRRAVESPAGGYAVMIAMRSQQEAQTVLEVLAAAGIRAGVVLGRGDDADRQTLAGLAQAGAVVMTCYPAERSVTRDPTDVPLHLLVAELHDARRHVDMLCSVYSAIRCEMLLSLDNEIVKALAPAAVATWMRRRAGHDGEAPSRLSHWLTRRLQTAMEREQRLLREELLSRDVYLNDLLAFSGRHD